MPRSRGLESSVQLSIPSKVGSAAAKNGACMALATLLKSRSNCTSVGE